MQNATTAHDTAWSWALVTTGTGALQELPSKVRAPFLSTVTQNEAEVQDTETRSFPGSMLEGALQELPLNVTARPLSSTEAQNDGLGHETEVG